MMRTRIIAVAVAALAAALYGRAGAAGKDPTPVTVVYADDTTVGLKSLEIGYTESGLLGSSFKKLDKLPVKTEKLQLKVPLANLAKIEFVSVDKKAKVIKLRLTAADGKSQPIEGALDSDKDIVWQGKHPFADSEAVLDVARIKAILLRREKK